MIAVNWKQWNSGPDESGLGQGMNIVYLFSYFYGKILPLLNTAVGPFSFIILILFQNKKWDIFGISFADSIYHTFIAGVPILVFQKRNLAGWKRLLQDGR